MQESSQKRRSSTPLTHSPKHQHTVSSSHSSSRSGRSARGRFCRSRSHKSPPTLSRREVESSSHERSAGPSPPPRREVRSKRKQRRRSPSPTLRREMHERQKRRSYTLSPRHKRTPSPSESPSSDREDSTASFSS